MTAQKISKLHVCDWLSTLQEPAKRQQTIRPVYNNLHDNELKETVRVYVHSDGDTVYRELLSCMIGQLHVTTLTQFSGKKLAAHA